MKNTRKVVALVLALVMVFALSATAFAATPNHTVAVTIKLYGDEAYTENVTTEEIATLADGAEHLFDVPDYAEPDVPDGYTAADALIALYMKLYGYGPGEASDIGTDEVDYHWSYTSKPVEFAGWGLYFETYEGLSSDAGKYYYVGTSVNDEGETVYLYYWEGETWNFYINGEDEPTDWTSSHYAFDTLTSIQFDYNMTKTAVFESDTFIPGAETAPSGN